MKGYTLLFAASGGGDVRIGEGKGQGSFPAIPVKGYIPVSAPPAPSLVLATHTLSFFVV